MRDPLDGSSKFCLLRVDFWAQKSMRDIILNGHDRQMLKPLL